MKKFYILLVVILCTLHAWADPITRQQAQQKAAAFLKEINAGATLSTTAASKAPRKVNGRTVSDQAYYYVFNTDNKQGYVIASGDDVAVPVLAYATEGEFNEDSIPDNMRAWLKGYELEIAWAQENGYTVNTSATTVGKNGPVSINGVVQPVPLTAAKTTIAYMVPTTWDQNTPYFNQCSFKRSNSGSSSSCYTGCVATAMAQVMYYWGAVKGFKHGCTALEGYTSESYSYIVPALSAVSAFSWSNMTTGKPTSTNAINAVAQLMRYCGQSVYMDYGTYAQGGSGAQSTDIPPALVNNFGYDRGAAYVQRAKYTSAEWENLIYNELANGRPVLMDGVDISEQVGHEFVCDGYNASTNKFHFNWGWSGSYNSTYCALSALAPGGTGSGGTSSSNGNYTPMSGAVIGIQPPISDDERETSSHDQLTIEAMYLAGPATLSRDARSHDASSVVTQGLVFNTTNETHTYEFCLGIYNDEGVLVDNTPVRNYGEIPVGSGFYFNNDFSFGAEMPYGTYKIIPICRDEGTDTWYPMEGAGTRYIQAVVAENTVTLTPAVSLSLSNWTSSGSRTYTNKVNITNNGLEEFTGELYLMVNGSMVAYMAPNSIAAGATVNYTIPYTSSNLSSASNKMVLADPYGMGVPYTNVSGYANVDWDINWEGYIDGDNNLYADSYKATFMLTNFGDNAYSHTVTATLFEEGKSPSTGTKLSKTLSVPAKSKGEVEFNFTGATRGKTYDLQITYYIESGEETETLSDYGYALTLARGTAIITADDTYYAPDQDGILAIPEEAVYVDARYSDKGENIGEGGNTNTLFVLKAGTTPAASLEGRNVVVGNTAATITLDDGMEFYSPVDFTADDVVYHRTFSQGFNGQDAHWSTLLLPFAIESVTADGQDVDWFRAADDADKQFWLMDFTGETDGQAQFGYVTTTQANHPYLIAVPDAAWGEEQSLVGRTLAFSARNVAFTADSPKGVVSHNGKYDFIGRTWASSHKRKYPLNSEGTRFAFTDEFDASPFRAYFVAYNSLGSQSDINLALPAPEPTAIISGDVNHDGSVTIADVTALVDIILGKDDTQPFRYNHSMADINRDGSVTIADVTALVDNILGK